MTNTYYNGLKFKFFTNKLDIKKEKDSGLWAIRGYAATSDLDRQNDIISPEALKKATKHLLENTTVFYEHEHNQYPVGRVLNAGVDKGGLWIEVLVSKTAEQVWTLIQEKILNSFSIGGKVINQEKVKEEKKEYNLITDIELFEVSIVGLPANPNARFSIMKSIQEAYKEDNNCKNGLCNIKQKVGEKMTEVKKEKKEEKVEEKKDVKIEEKKIEVKKEDKKEVIEKEKKEVVELTKKAEEKKVESEKEEKKEEPKIEEKKEDKKEEITKEEIEEIVKEEEVEKKEDKETELFEITLSEELGKKLDEIKLSIDALTTMLKNKDAGTEKKEDILDGKKVEEIIIKALDEKLGKIRLVPSRKGTIVKLESEKKDSDTNADIDTLYDEEKFDKLPEKEKTKVKKAGWKHLIAG